MKRPLACAGFLYLVIQLLAGFLPPAAFGPLAAVFLAAVFPAWQLGGRFRTHAVLACTVTGAALLLRMAAFTWMMAPIQARAGTQAEIHAAVVETSPGFLEDTVRAGVLVDEVNLNEIPGSISAGYFVCCVSCGKLQYVIKAILCSEAGCSERTRDDRPGPVKRGRAGEVSVSSLCRSEFAMAIRL